MFYYFMDFFKWLDIDVGKTRLMWFIIVSLQEEIN